MASRADVKKFLDRFKGKLEVFGVAFPGREKNAQALLEMEMVPSDREVVLKELEVQDYSEGPLDETMHGSGKMWVFGKEIADFAIYIKIALGQTNNKTICISFHAAEYELNYPFK